MKLPATTPPEIEAVLRVAEGCHALSQRNRRFAIIVPLVVAGLLMAMFLWAGSRGVPIYFFFAFGVVIAAAYDVMKLFRVIEITPTHVEYRVPLQFLSWRLQTSEMRLIDVDLEEKSDFLRFETKTGAKRRVPITRAMSAQLRR